MIHLAILLAALAFTAGAGPFGMGRFVDYEPKVLDVACTDVRRLDVRNMTFRVEDEDGDDVLELRFRHGKTAHGTAPGDAYLDWKSDVVSGRAVALEDGTTLRFVFIADVHDTSTSKQYVFVLSCRDGKLQQVFHAGGEGFGANLRRAAAGEIQLGWLVWRRGDSHAEPSRERIQTLSWRRAFGRFAIVGDAKRDFKSRDGP